MDDESARHCAAAHHCGTQRLTRAQQQALKQAITSLIQVHHLFQQEEIWPDYCDQALATLWQMSTLVKMLYQITDSSVAFLSSQTDPYRHQLLTELRGLALIMGSTLRPYLQAFRPLCQTSSIQAFRQRQKIEETFEQLEEESEQAHVTLTRLLDQASFEAKNHLYRKEEHHNG